MNYLLWKGYKLKIILVAEVKRFPNFFYKFLKIYMHFFNKLEVNIDKTKFVI